jgi:signal transduction histidine kinase
MRTALDWPHPPTLSGIAARITQREQKSITSDIGYLLVDRTGHHIAGKVSMPLPQAGYSDLDYRDGIEGIDHGRALMTQLPGGDKLVLVADSESVEEFNQLLLRIVAVAFGATIFTGVIGGLALSSIIRRRIQGINLAAEAIIGGDLRRRMPIDGSDSEFDRQSATLNRMLDKIDELMLNLKQVSSDIAHDLRTPLARLHHRLEGALSPNLDIGGVHNEVRSGLTQVEDILDLFAALLRISEVEAGERRAGFGLIQLDVLVRDIADTFAPAIEDEGRTLKFDCAEPISLRGDKELLTQMIVNLLENAARHTPIGTAITIQLCRSKEAATLIIADTGNGIGNADQAMLKRRFGRQESSRSTPGHGLGLALVEAVARLHDGEVRLEDGNPGLIVSVLLPVKNGFSSV